MKNIYVFFVVFLFVSCAQTTDNNYKTLKLKIKRKDIIMTTINVNTINTNVINTINTINNVWTNNVQNNNIQGDQGF